MRSCHTPDQLDIRFDGTHAVANAGLLLAATLAERLGIEQAVDRLVDLGDRPGHHRPGRKVRWDRDSGRWFAFVLLACAVVCLNRL
jgi:hypothetical protein